MGDRGQYEIATAIRTACVWKVTACKVGNVHRYADFRDLAYLDFRPVGGCNRRPAGERVREHGLDGPLR